MSEGDALAAMRVGDPEALADALLAMSEKDRRACHEALEELTRSRERLRYSPETAPHFEATQIAAGGTGSVRDLRYGLGLWIGRVHPRLAEVVTARPARTVSGIVRAILTDQRNDLWPLVRDLVRAGTIPRPDDENWSIGLMMWLWSGGGFDEPREDVETHLRDDPALVEEVWVALEREAVVDHIAATIRVGDRHQLLRLVDDGILDRARMLEVAARGMTRDLRPTSAAFFRKVFDALDPTTDEVAAHAPAFVRTLAGPHATEQRHAADRLHRLVAAGVDVDAHTVAGAVATPLAGRQKGAAMSALRLLGELPLDEVTRGATAAVGLGHPHADVQGAVLAMLEPGPVPQEVREELLAWTDAVAPEHRQRLQDLLGLEVPAAEGEDEDVPDLADLRARLDALPGAVVDRLGLADALARVAEGHRPAPARGAMADAPERDRVVPITDVEELVDVVVRVLAGSGTPMDVERVVDGFARIPPSAAAASLRSPIVRLVAGEDVLRHWGASAVGNVAVAAAAWCDRKTPHAPAAVTVNRRGRGKLLTDLVPGRRGHGDTPALWAFDGSAEAAGCLGFLAGRLFEAVVVGLTSPRPTLALPSTEDGWLEPDDLVQRVDALAGHRRPLGRFDAVQALLRLRPDRTADPDVLASHRSPVAAAVRAALGAPARVSDEGLARATRRDGPAPTGLVVADVPNEHPRGAPVTVVRFAAPEPAIPLRRDDPVGQVHDEVRVPEQARAEPTWWTPLGSAIPWTDRLGAAWTLTALPRHRDLVLARAASLVWEDVDSDRSTTATDVYLASAIDPDVPLGLGDHALLAGGLSARNEVVGTTATDVLVSAAADGRLDPELLGTTLAELARVATTTRVAARLEPATSDPLPADAVVRVLLAWLRDVDELPHDAHAALAVLDAACTRTGLGVDDPAVRDRLGAAATGSSKRARLSRRLLDLEPTTPTLTSAALLDALLSRAERWTERTRA